MMLKFVLLSCLIGIVICQDDASSRRACPKFEHFDMCMSGCTETCENIGEPCGIRVMCPRPGCVCDEGYVRSGPKGRCIPVEDCKRCTHENEVYSECAPASRDCEVSCQDDLSATSCLAVCTKRCVCKEGYIRNGDACILPEDCGM